MPARSVRRGRERTADASSLPPPPCVAMKLLVAMMKHETNTFSPVPTDKQRFFAWGEYERAAAVAAYKGTGMPTGAYLDLAEAAGHEVVLPMAAEAMPSGPVQEEAYEHLVGKILEAVREGGIDACLLDLHGAMVCETTDGERPARRHPRDPANAPPRRRSPLPDPLRPSPRPARHWEQMVKGLCSSASARSLPRCRSR